MNTNYWREMYGFQSSDFINGVIAGVTAYAFWKDGIQVIGIAERPLQEEIKEIRESMGKSI